MKILPVLVSGAASRCTVVVMEAFSSSPHLARLVYGTSVVSRLFQRLSFLKLT